MAKYRILLMVSLTWFTLLFNVERIDIAGQPPLNLDSLLYLFVLSVILLTVTFPNMGKLNYAVAGASLLAGYVVTALLVRPGWADRSVVLILVECASLLITLFFMRKVSAALLDFEIAVETFVLGVNGSRLLSTTEGIDQINAELYRARRFERPLSIILIEIPVPGKEQQSGSTTVETDFIRWRISSVFKNRFMQVSIAKLLTTITYKGDLMVEYNENIVVCLPETGKHESRIFVQQFNTLAQAQLDLPVRVGSATFSEDGLVLERLLEVAQESLEKASPNDHGDDNPSDGGESSEWRRGDVFVSDDDRVRLSRELAWVNALKYQSHSARSIYLVVKRLIDIGVVLVTLPFTLPVGLLVAIAIMIDDPGTPFYLQERTGYGGRSFKMFKFRSMYRNAPTMPAKEIVLPDGTIRYEWPDKTSKDPRITRVGRVIRKTSLDELPQLINVLKGDMSLVGPRPTSWQLDKYTLHQTERLTVQPGITGLWQVCARESKNFDERLLWDLQYIEKISLWLDMQILIRTAFQAFKKGV